MKNFTSCSPGVGVLLQIKPRKFQLALGVHMHPLHPGYAHEAYTYTGTSAYLGFSMVGWLYSRLFSAR